MFKITKVEVIPRRERFGIQHKLTVAGDIKNLRSAFSKNSSANSFSVEGNTLRLNLGGEEFLFSAEKDIEEYYTDEVNEVWKRMVMEAMGMEEPYRFYSFYDEAGKHIGTVGYKQDCENPQPIILIYRNFDI